ncbi:MAG: hypothetical protein IJK24_02395 [Oscillospiraceae bacterium]|nr:hypothetical protein [Oscillospiraceae bacterium]
MGLLDILFWVIAIFCIAVGVICWFMLFIDSSLGKKIWGVVVAIIGVFIFIRALAWLKSICFSLFVTGLVLGLLSTRGENNEISSSSGNTKRSEDNHYGVAEAFLDTYCEYELTKAAVKDAIRESKQ